MKRELNPVLEMMAKEYMNSKIDRSLMRLREVEGKIAVTAKILECVCKGDDATSQLYAEVVGLLQNVRRINSGVARVVFRNICK